MTYAFLSALDHIALLPLAGAFAVLYVAAWWAYITFGSDSDERFTKDHNRPRIGR